MRKVAGFTIIELVVVITILGILAAVALPKFFDIQNDARAAAAKGVAGGVASGAAINYGARLAQGNLAGSATVVNDCTTAKLGLVLTGGWPDAKIKTSLVGAAPATNGATFQCEFYHSAYPAGSTTINIIAVTS